MALNLAPLSRWTLRDKAAQRRLHLFIDSRSQRIGKHHEIYLSDNRKASPSKWKTIIRQPMK